MKAIIMERRGDDAALLCEDGTFVRRRIAGEVGETVELTAEAVVFPARRRSRWMRSAVAAMLALTLTGGTVGYLGGTASAYVSLDVEDSAIELTVNHFGRVIAVSALSDDAEELADSLSGEVKNRKTEDALDITMERLRAKGYLDDADTAVIAGVTSDSENHKAALKSTVENAVERSGEHTAYVCEASRAEREQAMSERVSAGKFAFERDHGRPAGALHDGSRPEETLPRETSAGAEPSVPASAEIGPDDAPAEEPSGQTPEQSGKSEFGSRPQEETAGPGRAERNPPQGSAPQDEPARQEPQQDSAPQGEPARQEPQQDSAPQGEPARQEPPQDSAPQGEPARQEPPQDSAPQGEPARQEPPQDSAPQGEPAQQEPPQDSAPQGEPARQPGGRSDAGAQPPQDSFSGAPGRPEQGRAPSNGRDVAR